MSTRKLNLRDGWIRRGVRYLIHPKGLKRDITNYTRKQRNNRYKKKILSKRKQILKAQSTLDKLLSEEKKMYDKYQRVNYNDKVLDPSTSLNRYRLNYRKY